MLKKVFVALLVLGGAMMTVPELRAWARPHLEPAFGDVMDWWGDQMRPLVDAALRWSAKNELRTVLRTLKETSPMGQPPDASRFPVYVAQNHFSGRGGNDPWGQPYYLIVSRDSLTAGSAGPDHERGTPDDVLVSVPRW